MKRCKTLLLLLVLLLLSSEAHAWTKIGTLYWTETSNGNDPTTYTLWCGGTSGGPYSIQMAPPHQIPPDTIQGGSMQVWFNGIPTPSPQWYCAVTADNANGSSGPSNEIQLNLGPYPGPPWVMVY